MKKTRVVLIGAGAHARVVWDVLERVIAVDRACDHMDEVIAVLDDDVNLWGHGFHGVEIRGPIEILKDVQADAAIIAIGDNRVRRRAYEIIKRIGMPLRDVIHPSAIVAEEVRIGDGVVILPNAVASIGCEIGDNTILDMACTLDYGCSINAHTHLASGVQLASGVSVGEGTLVGIGSVVIPNITIGCWSTIAAGSIVTQNVPDRVLFAQGVATPINDKEDRQ